MEDEEREKSEKMDQSVDGENGGDRTRIETPGTEPTAEGTSRAGRTTPGRASSGHSPVDIQAAIKIARANKSSEPNDAPLLTDARPLDTNPAHRTLIAKAKKGKKSGMQSRARKLNMLGDDVPFMNDSREAQAGE